MTPKGFWSYARDDDEHLDNVLTRLRGRIAGEISMLLGQEIGMFQDIYDIRTGDDWEDKLRCQLTDASFMIPVLTPRYFARPWCREEVSTFLRLAEGQGRKPLMFPIYFVEDRAYENGDLDAVRAELSRFQFFDFRSLRFESEPTKIDKAINDFAKDVVQKLIDIECVAVEKGKPKELSSSSEEAETLKHTTLSNNDEPAETLATTKQTDEKVGRQSAAPIRVEKKSSSSLTQENDSKPESKEYPTSVFKGKKPTQISPKNKKGDASLSISATAASSEDWGFLCIICIIFSTILHLVLSVEIESNIFFFCYTPFIAIILPSFLAGRLQRRRVSIGAAFGMSILILIVHLIIEILKDIIRWAFGLYEQFSIFEFASVPGTTKILDLIWLLLPWGSKLFDVLTIILLLAVACQLFFLIGWLFPVYKVSK